MVEVLTEGGPVSDPPTTDEEPMPYRAADRRIRIQMIFLAIALFGFTLLLAFRSEANARDIRTGLYESCLTTAARSDAINPGRAALANLLINLVEQDVTLSPADKAAADATIKGGLLVPPINCGLRP